MKSLIAAFAFLASMSMAEAQAPPSPIGGAIVCNTCSVPLAASTTSNTIPIPAASPPNTILTLRNTGMNDAYMAQGASTITANLTNTVLRSGSSICEQVASTGGYIAAITQTGTTNIDVYQGTACVLLQSANATASAGLSTGPNGGPQPLYSTQEGYYYSGIFNPIAPGFGEPSALYDANNQPLTSFSINSGPNALYTILMDQNGNLLNFNTPSFVQWYEIAGLFNPTTQIITYPAGDAIGNEAAVTVATTAGFSGELTKLALQLAGGSTSPQAVYVWYRNPASTTCTDDRAFVPNAGDNQFLVFGGPIILNPIAAATPYDTESYAKCPDTNCTIPIGSFINASANGNLYVCDVALASTIVTTTGGLTVQLGGNRAQQ